MANRGQYLPNVLSSEFQMNRMERNVKLVVEEYKIGFDNSISGTLRITFEARGYVYKFRMSQMHGQCGVLVVHSLPIEYFNKLDNKAICYAVHKISVAVMDYLAYGMLMLSHTNITLIGHFQMDDWKYATDFHNPHSGNDVWVLVYEPDRG